MNRKDIEGRGILEVGCRDVNGSVRGFLMSLGARQYVGVDIEPGPGVDRLCDVSNLVSEFGSDSFDVVVTTEMLEHVRDWRSAISNLKRVVAPEGLLIITTRSFGFNYHDFPGDYWRYELDDMRGLFRDLQILKLVPDPQVPGVFLKGRKPPGFREIDHSHWKLFSVVKAERSEPDLISDDEIVAYSKRMKEIMEIGFDVTRILQSVDLADVGQHDFRKLWRGLERLSDQTRVLTLGSESQRALSPWLQGMARIGRRVLELLTEARLARGRSFGWVRGVLLESAGGAIGTNILRVPWAVVEDEEYREIPGTLQAIRKVCLKVNGYARPLARE